MNQGIPELVAWPISGNPSNHKRLQSSFLHHEDQKHYDSLLSKWSHWCSQRNKNPIEGPVEDIVNFLADVFKEGYLY